MKDIFSYFAQHGLSLFMSILSLSQRNNFRNTEQNKRAMIALDRSPELMTACGSDGVTGFRNVH